VSEWAERGGCKVLKIARRVGESIVIGDAELTLARIGNGVAHVKIRPRVDTGDGAGVRMATTGVTLRRGEGVTISENAIVVVSKIASARVTFLTIAPLSVLVIRGELASARRFVSQVLAVEK